MTQHPTNDNPTSGDVQGSPFNDYAFKLTKDVSGTFASQSNNFDFALTVTLPDSYNETEFRNVTVRVNGYTANLLMGNTTNYAPQTVAEISLPANKIDIVYLHHGDSFSIDSLPAGTIITVEEQATGQKYQPSFSGKWGDITQTRTGSADKGAALATGTIVVGEDGAYVQFTNTLRDEDVTATGIVIVISNLPYILMVGIALTGIGFLTLSKKRRSR